MREDVGYLTYPNPQLTTSLLGYEDLKVLAVGKARQRRLHTRGRCPTVKPDDVDRPP